MKRGKKCFLVLEDSTRFEGESFGAPVSSAGEVVFNTALTGYPESLSDPSYKGQLLVLTYPLVGNYGVPDPARDADGLLKFFESDRVQISGLVVSDYSHRYSHWNAKKSLSDWLKENDVPGICGIDTRAVTRHIREKGAMPGKIIYDGTDIEFYDPNRENLMEYVSVKKPVTYGKGRYKIMLVDCGVKNNIIRCLLEKDATVKRVPWNHELSGETCDGLFISNGPGDPAKCTALIENLAKALKQDIPVFGICLGSQLMALAAGAKTYKLKYGHRSHNQPVLKFGTERAYITSQNHGFAVDASTLPGDWEPLFINLNDRTNEGLRHKCKPFFSAQFHPEASGGPSDTKFLFDEFMEKIIRFKKGNSRTLDVRKSLSYPPFTPHLFSPHYRGEMERGEKLKKVLVLGSGALKIGEAGEFDYSGSQALKALKQEGIKTILINPNIATVQTSPQAADKTYFLPVTPYFVEKVITREKPQAVMLSVGGQTALNCGIALYKSGVFKRHGVKVLGTPVSAIIETEDRALFVKKLAETGVKTPRSLAVGSVKEALNAAEKLGYPVMVRAAFTLGGQGSGVCPDGTELSALAEKSFSCTGQILVEEYLNGWKELEYEIVRDAYDNCIAVCNMENFDPLGIHTGESIVVAPSQTLTNAEYHKLREISIKVVRSIGIVGECNIQYAVDPDSGDYRVIEVNARLSRSSALASKATGYPLAFIAAKLGLGYGLHELKNSVTGVTTACFEPALDYVVCKIPRWDLGKFAGVSRIIGSSMKSVGEVMAIGRSFEEAFQKGLRMTGHGMHGFAANRDLEFLDLEKELAEPTDMRVFAIAEAFKRGFPVEKIFQLTRIDRWFLEKLRNIHEIAERLSGRESLKELDRELLLEAKKAGFSDFQIARLALKSGPDEISEDLLEVRGARKKRGIIPFVKQIDTLAAEYPAKTNYLYLTYHGSSHDISFKRGRKTIIVLGSGAYRIGSSVEFDWCSVSALKTIKTHGMTGIMINYNPETVSTDYDVCDRLYFDELSFERVMDIIDLEKPAGVMVSVGGQIPNNLAMRLHKMKVGIPGASAVSIDASENRRKFSAMLDRLGIDQPRWKEMTNLKDIKKFAEQTGYPLLVRPSYVLSGAAMNIVSNGGELERFLTLATKVSKQHPVVVSEFIEGAKEIEIDAVAKNGGIIAYAISEHLEFAGVHSGDATIVFPAQKIYVETTRRIKKIARLIAMELKVSGPFNIQFLAKDNDIKVIECNLRASRSFPFISKVLKIDFIDLAVRIMLGLDFEKPSKSMFDLDCIGVKAPQFSFSRLHKADPVLGVEMASTGEVGCIGENFHEALLKAMLSVGYEIPRKNILISSGPPRSKMELLESAKLLCSKGYRLFGTRGSADFLNSHSVECKSLPWPDQGKKPDVTDFIKSGKIDLVVNIPKNLSKTELKNDYIIRRTAVDHNIPLITNARLAAAFIAAFSRLRVRDLAIKSWDEYS
ncbi:MAG: carbamoyl-phosphate synthase (glutamine-hydrolyzing) large subunit [Elusimicrobia bacterium]|nr:carbamoyl-phosphate synthase (glutamine-hydrolyzing) large subunit [Elusimicrobiota bacterium]